MTTQETGNGEEDSKSAREFNEIARTIFAPIYPVSARQAIEHRGRTTGLCIDAGAAPVTSRSPSPQSPGCGSTRRTRRSRCSPAPRRTSGSPV